LNQTSAATSVSEPNWVRVEGLSRLTVPAELIDWLRDTGSLTARLKGCCGGGFRVRLLHQGWGRPLGSERRLLRIRRGATAVVREVELLCHEVPLVFARTVIPVASLRGPAKRLTLLGERPLGEVLFTDPHMRRGRMEVARLLPRHPLFGAATAGLEQRPDEIWGRRTLFHLRDASLLVNEVFLPAIRECAV
jgi:chorismate--pyruvate lyase